VIGSAGLRYLTRTLAALALCLLLLFSATGAQEEISRKIKSKVQPNYPELAKRMNISGTVKLQIVVAANGTVKNAKIVGGHPLLANAASDAVKKWRFEPASEETTGLVEFRFNPTE
jgi:TonB family protein